MCNRCGCQSMLYEESRECSRCNMWDNQNVRQLACAAERFVREENREMRCCEHRCACQYRNCVHRCQRDCD
ncbi:MAG: hypothetical protein RR690_03825 [Longicatena sp.]